ncbi:hypothetical protein H2198_000740 [Neophaeococcomyces mojaviensis]|uniref:Uncharacterized protein n=1 Tax=Neophaeococcomyces mojaviensis TaxID=3383035 RepID=A0ACC3AIR3_9EURO|nr:hypothetical protein H2198_000740 [Knufia sp. JES_112]
MSFTSQESTISNETFGKDVSFKLHQLTGSMSISPSGRDVVLGSKEGLHIIDLDSPWSLPRFLPHRTPWEVADVQWSPFADRDYWVASTSNQKALVWNLEARGWRNSIEYVLHGHTRAITDINFSAHHKDKLATCAVDSFVHCWDLRAPDRPAVSFSDWFAGATQVKWSRQDEHVVASAHDKYLHIWDDRKGAYPARTIEAHNTKIYGIDWNRFEPSKIVTCSLDKTIKFWDTNNDEDVPEKIIETSFPVWRARHTPFGWGLMVMPQRGNGNLHLYDRRSLNGHIEPVQVFPGHKGQVKEFLWRAFGTVKEGVDHRDFQLVSWGTDRELRLHAVSKTTLGAVGYEKGHSKPQRLRFTRRGARYRTFRDEVQEIDLPFGAPARADSFPASNQFLRVKGRASTTFGMSKAPLSQFKGWLQAGKRDRRTGMHGKGVVRPDTDPISWMKNVKIASTDTDALADEITQVGDKFKKVEFETVDMSQRKATLSLQSPWGEQGMSVYTRVDFRFPKTYPKEAQAILHLQRTNLIKPEVHKKISADMQRIAEMHLSRGRGCVEAVVRFLLREQSLEQVMNWIMRDSMTDSKIIEAASMAEDASDDSDDDQLDTVPDVSNASGGNRVPLAKRCGAMWCENGKLACFFLPKSAEPSSLLSTLGTGQLDEAESSKLFGGFGRFEMDSPSRKAKDASNIMNDETNSNASDEESMFSSSSSSSSDSSAAFGVQAKFVPWQRMTVDSLQRSKSMDGSQKSTILEGVKAAETGRNAFWIIHDLTELLPSKQVTAQDYQINGDVATVCEQNAQVAARNMQEDIASIWRLTALTLNSPSANQISEATRTNPDLLLLTKRVSLTVNHHPTTLKIQNHAAALHEGQPADILQTGSLLGMQYLVPVLLEIFERAGNVQMLALLSAVFILAQESISLEALKKSRISPDASQVRISPSDSNTGSQTFLHGLAGRADSPRRGGSIAVQDPRLSILGETNPVNAELSTSMPTSTLHTGYFDNSQASSGALSVIAHDPSGFVSTIHSTSGSIAGSPENHRNISRRSEFSIATASLFALTKSSTVSSLGQVTSSDRPHLQQSSKSLKASPEDSYLNDSKSRLRSSLSLANVSSYKNESTRNAQLGKGRVKSILKNSGNATPVQKVAKKKKLKTKFTNTASFSSEQHASPIILPIDMYPSCLNYIKQYITLLEVWRLWPQRAEMQQVYTRTTTMLEKLLYGTNAVTRPISGERGLEIRRCCSTCGGTLVPIEKNGTPIGWDCVSDECTSGKSKPSKRQTCSICETVATGLCIPCLQCGHLTCYDCAQGWFMQGSDNNRKRSNSSTMSAAKSHTSADNENIYLACPTGCGCTCSTLTSIAVPYPTTSHDKLDELLIAPPLTPRSEGYQESSRTSSTVHETRIHRGQSVGGADNSARNALLAFNLNRTRSISSSKTGSTAVPGIESGSDRERGGGNGRRTRDNSISVVDELLPWAGDRNASLGRGVGGGLSRGLRNVGSDATIRKL